MHQGRLTFHHIGVACDTQAFEDDSEQRSWELLGYLPEGRPWMDKLLGMRGQFLVPAYGAPRIELVAPLGRQSPVAPWLKRGVKLYHLGLMVGDMLAEIERLREQRAKLMLSPTPAVAFGNRRVAFLMMPNRLLVELIEST